MFDGIQAHVHDVTNEPQLPCTCYTWQEFGSRMVIVCIYIVHTHTTCTVQFGISCQYIYTCTCTLTNTHPHTIKFKARLSYRTMSLTQLRTCTHTHVHVCTCTCTSTCYRVSSTTVNTHTQHTQDLTPSQDTRPMVSSPIALMYLYKYL